MVNRTLINESALRDVVADAYATARSEVYDVVPPEGAALTPRQRHVLVRLEAAEADLRMLRHLPIADCA
jgi:hypothetical protein